MKKHEGKTFYEKLKYYVDGEADTFFEYFMLLVVFVNTVTLGFETSPSIEAKYSDLLFWIDQICLYIFVFELFIKVIVYNRKFFGEMRTDEEGKKFFHINKWNIFDLFIVLIFNNRFSSVLRRIPEIERVGEFKYSHILRIKYCNII